ncbi:bifunctional 3-(3-hydroxy-phenyl)propionate/3-hydroxycinnamic acid hydroxylase [Devosia naphthalenivorans]|uniref:bifunctional 3-(3-hydroxy-phenyl)propionate/3-hydroxycinnamic acid hydroxylase n=1 Tax=Devosia naphthalenivorans TaxID=2082392 RepID=UPI000D33D001|nr:bifunctional 3-(3-hydroxy-phenyl)propionate/3-hydroxycinnamic acid hydroxylase [Devosia naphthalenivorans]
MIVGAGPTGLTVGNFLGRMGLSVLLIERNLMTVQEPRAVSIDDESMRTMQAIGLHEVVRGIVASGSGSHYLSPSGRTFLTVEPTSQVYGFNQRNAFQQPELEQVLRDGLTRYPNVQQFFGWEFDGLGQDENYARGTIRKTETGETRQVAGRYLVASDGGRSPIRTSLGIEMKGSTFAERWLIIDLFKTDNRFRHTQVYCDPARPCLALPRPAGIRRYEFMLFPGEDERTVTDHGFVRSLLARVGPDADGEFRRIAVYTFHARLAERWRSGRVFLAGDAAHLTPPFAGQGMNSGLRDAHNLAWKLAEAVRGSVSNEFLDSYMAERGPHAWDMIKLALRMGTVIMPRNRFKAWLIRSAFQILKVYPAARDYFGQMKYKLKPRLRAGLIWPDGCKERRSVVGELMPQPIVEDIDGKRSLLDERLEDGPAVIVYDAFPDRALSSESLSALREAGVQVIGITPEWNNVVLANFPVYRDASGLLSHSGFKCYLGSALLLRRDRYIAGVTPAGEADKLMPWVHLLRASPSPLGATPALEPHQLALK